ncbi:MAG: hypothetical protein JW762_06045 [Dehalococcoidales bacterium]|nr:hypothetical protein [Dehalococcoidales bacterium]
MSDLCGGGVGFRRSGCRFGAVTLSDFTRNIHPSARGRYIFPSEPNGEGYAYHYGGRKELQFNVGFEGSEELRYGIAFSLERGGFFGNPLDIKPKVLKLNEYFGNHSSEFEDMWFWYWENDKRSERMKVEPISEDLIRSDVFLFWGKLAPKKTVQAHDALSLFDRLLPVYEYVEGNATQTKQIKGLQFKLGNIRLEQTQAQSKRETREMKLRHNALVKTLHEILKRSKKNAGNTNTGLPAQVDMVVRTKDGLLYYEVKTGDEIRTCIREAIGQLLEYSYWPGATEAKPLIIVTENKMTPKAYKYLKTLRERFSLPIYHQRLDMKLKDLEDMN